MYKDAIQLQITTEHQLDDKRLGADNTQKIARKTQNQALFVEIALK